MTINSKRRALFLSHGGGPLPLLGDEGHAEMVSCLQGIAQSIAKPSAIILVSAHWEAEVVSVTTGERPELIYDYYGFPPESYEIQYPCAGNPALANQVVSALQNSGIEVNAEGSRGFDHGLFVPLKIMYPAADIPCIQVSLLNNLDPSTHIALGRTLQELATEDTLLIGSGFSFHNMQEFFATATSQKQQANKSFDNWLADTCSEHISETERAERLVNWASAPAARFCHPREEHLLPLHVCYGYTESACTKTFKLKILGKHSSMFLWD